MTFRDESDVCELVAEHFPLAFRRMLCRQMELEAVWIICLVDTGFLVELMLEYTWATGVVGTGFRGILWTSSLRSDDASCDNFELALGGLPKNFKSSALSL